MREVFTLIFLLELRPLIFLLELRPCGKAIDATNAWRPWSISFRFHLLIRKAISKTNGTLWPMNPNLTKPKITLSIKPIPKRCWGFSSSKIEVFFPDPADWLYWPVSHKLGLTNHKREEADNERLQPLSHSWLNQFSGYVYIAKMRVEGIDGRWPIHLSFIKKASFKALTWPSIPRRSGSGSGSRGMGEPGLFWNPVSLSKSSHPMNLLCWRSLEPGVYCYHPSNRKILKRDKILSDNSSTPRRTSQAREVGPASTS